jgi:hypothetical protein
MIVTLSTIDPLAKKGATRPSRQTLGCLIAQRKF